MGLIQMLILRDLRELVDLRRFLVRLKDILGFLTVGTEGIYVT